ncbi:MAG: thiamine pyrophosphate-binding protein [Alphaproteobacteria bacterium]
MARMTGARCLAEFLERSGVTHVFWVPAVLMETLDELGRGNRVSRIMAHGEKAAVYMADGYARVSGRPGVCFAQMIGASNLAAGLLDPWLAHTPIVALTGGATAEHMNRHTYQQIYGRPAFATVTKELARVERAELMPETLRQAFRTATSGTPGPVHIEIAGHFAEVENIEADLDVITEARFQQSPPYRPVADNDAIDQALALLAEAERPVIVAGGGVRASGAGGQVVALAERLGIPVATALNAKDTVPGRHPLNIGVPGTYSRESANRALVEADLVFFVGSHTGSQVTAHWHLPPAGTSVIQLGIDGAEMGRHYPNAVSLMGDARATLEVMVARADGTSAASREPWTARVAELVANWRAEYAAAMDSDATPIRPERICRELSDCLPQGAVLVSDTGHAGMWTGGFVDLNHDPDRMGQSYLRAAGSLGWGLPASIGAKLAAPDRPVVLFSGDGGFWYHIAEIETAVRWNAAVVFLVNNNGALNQGMDPTAHGDTWKFSDASFVDIARAMGAEGVTVTDPGELRGALDIALASGKPYVVDIASDITAQAPTAFT